MFSRELLAGFILDLCQFGSSIKKKPRWYLKGKKFVGNIAYVKMKEQESRRRQGDLQTRMQIGHWRKESGMDGKGVRRASDAERFFSSDKKQYHAVKVYLGLANFSGSK